MKLKRLLFVSYGGGHAAMLIPVIKKLQCKGLYQISILGLTTAKKQFERADIQVVGYQDFAFLCEEEYESIGKSLVGKPIENGLVSYEESVAYHGINFLDLVTTYGPEKAEELYGQQGRQIFNPVDFMGKVIEHLSPDLVVATNSPRSERAAIYQARQRGIKTLSLLDLFGTQQLSWMAKSDFSDVICVINDKVKETFVKNGRERASVVVTGNPAFDKLAIDNASEIRKDYRAKKDIGDKQVIFYAPQIEPALDPVTGKKGNPKLPLEIEQKLVQIVENSVCYHLIIRPHPSDTRVPQYDNANVSVSNQNEELVALLYGCDMVVTIASTVALEAYLIGKPVCTVDLGVATPNAPFSKMEMSHGVKDLDDLDGSIEEVFSRFDASDKVSNSSLGQATGNVVHQIEQLV